MQINEREFVVQARQGDSRAFGELVLLHQSFVYNLALRAVNDPHEAEDLAQETFIRAWQALPRFRSESRFSTWLYRIVVNLCYNRHPRLKREMEYLSVDENENLSLPQHEENPAEVHENRQIRVLLHQKINELPATQKMLIQLRYQQELSYEDIAVVMQMPLGTVKTGLFRAHSQLRAAMVDMEEVAWTR